MLIYHAGFDYIPLSASTADDRTDWFSRLGWYDLPGSFTTPAMLVRNDFTRFGYGRYFGFEGIPNGTYKAARPFPDAVDRSQVYAGVAIYGSNTAILQQNPWFGFSYTGTDIFRVILRDFGVIEVQNSAGTALWTSGPGAHTS